MNHTQLVTAFSTVNGTSFVGIDTLTNVTLKGGKSNPMQGKITKKMTDASVMVFQNKNSNGYENMVRRRLLSEGKDPDSFELLPRQWGTRIPNLPIVEHIKNGETKYYLEVIFLKCGKISYYLENVLIPVNNIIGLDSPTEGEQAGLSNKVIVRVYSADSITQVRIDNKIFV